ncbi:MAG: SusD/RagB family nutrient-binding outer membrane lipoprotein [Williamsia sp.]|nr:SusD/RagB family nutrient-binding outer membrane lipoprotein [Williamsia sp.]
MKKISIIAVVMLSLVACTKDISRFNQQTKSPGIVPASTLFSNAVKGLTDGLASTNVGVNVFRLVVQHWTTTTYTDEPNYDFTTRNIPQGWWTRMYRDVLVDLKEAKRIIESDNTIIDATKKNQAAMADIMQVYTYSVLVNTFGNVPYSEALDYNKTAPKYDDAKTIYDDLFTRLNADIAALNTAGAGFPATADVIYGGSVSSWIKFANSLKFRLAMIIADADPAKAKTAVQEADQKAFVSAADNAVFKYLAVTPNTNPLYVDLVQSNRQDFVAGKTLVDYMKTVGDPRLSQYFKPNDAGAYVGGVIGSTNTYSDYAKFSNKMVALDFPALLLSYEETEFDRAEAIERGFITTGTAAEHYNNAIDASVVYWGGSSDQAKAYRTNPAVAYATAAGTWKQKIGAQKWVALYNRGYEAWTEVRRLDYPALPSPAGAKSGFPNRFTYPTNEQTLNTASYTDAKSKMGDDKVEVKIFWDKN